VKFAGALLKMPGPCVCFPSRLPRLPGTSMKSGGPRGGRIFTATLKRWGSRASCWRLRVTDKENAMRRSWYCAGVLNKQLSAADHR